MQLPQRLLKFLGKYISQSDKARSTPEALTKLVALNNRHIVGVVEYVEKNDHIYFQGLAVEPSRHRQGIARALITRLEKLCTERDLQKLALATIEETGNVQVFERLGFGVVEREQTDQYESDLYDILHIVKMVRIVVRPVQAKQI